MLNNSTSVTFSIKSHPIFDLFQINCCPAHTALFITNSWQPFSPATIVCVKQSGPYTVFKGVLYSESLPPTHWEGLNLTHCDLKGQKRSGWSSHKPATNVWIANKDLSFLESMCVSQYEVGGQYKSIALRVLYKKNYPKGYIGIYSCGSGSCLPAKCS